MQLNKKPINSKYIFGLFKTLQFFFVLTIVGLKKDFKNQFGHSWFNVISRTSLMNLFILKYMFKYV